MPALGCRHPEPQAGQSCGLPVIIQILFCTRPGVRISQTITDYLGAYLVSLHAAISYSPADGLRAGALPVRLSVGSGAAFFTEPNFDFVLFFCALSASLFSSFWTAQIVLVSFFSCGPPCGFSVFSVFTVLICANSKKIKNDFPFLKNPCFLLLAPYTSHLISSICLFFCVEASRLRFSSFNSHIEDFLFHRIFWTRFRDSGFSSI